MSDFNKPSQAPNLDTSELDKAGLVSMDEKPKLTQEELDAKYLVAQPVAQPEAPQGVESVVETAGEGASGEKVEVAQEKPPVDAIALNNKFIRMTPREKKEALNNLSQEEIIAAAKLAADSRGMGGNSGSARDVYDTLSVFGFKPEIMEQPTVAEAFRSKLSSGRTHIYDVERVLSVLPESKKGILQDPSVKLGLIKSSIRYFNTSDSSARELMLPMIRKMSLTSEELRTIAESQEIKTNSDVYHQFVRYFGPKNLYPEL